VPRARYEAAGGGWTNIASGRLQAQADQELEQQWAGALGEDPGDEPLPLAAPEEGQPFARIHIPALGEDAVHTVVEGTRDEDLRTGPGRYAGC